MILAWALLDHVWTVEDDDESMRVTFLGTGTSHGIPVIGCECTVCQSSDTRNQRLRPSIFVETDSESLLVDATPDFRMQALRAGIRNVDAVLVTHTHADHVFGLDDLRAFTQRDERKMPVYSSAESLANIERVFPYACTDKPRWRGLPSFELCEVHPNQVFNIGATSVKAMSVPHGWINVLAYFFGSDFVYMTDCNEVTSDALEALQGTTVLVLDALRHRPHPSHLTVSQAVRISQKVRPKLTLLTHLCHELDHSATENELPPEVRIAYDGLQIEVNKDKWQIIG